MEQKIYLNWEDMNFSWDNIPQIWDEVIEVIEVIRKSGGMSSYVEGNPWDITKKELGEEKTKKFIKLFCRINELDYEQVIEPNSNIKITIGQMERVFNECNIDFKIKLL